ncbi:hypothetical protein A8708_21700 [Paenibacillus oryzisoli]|uniref:Uncharacterized protein n=1 Tax=Paenibacillus oryzisoli TaxID=1850517 RepID=A0A198A8F8_9BACL|nr:hypothetical protein A8708_21700 [Paenibacillus oryzisoli]
MKITIVGLMSIIIGAVTWATRPNGPDFSGLPQAIVGISLIGIGLILLVIAFIRWIINYK